MRCVKSYRVMHEINHYADRMYYVIFRHCATGQMDHANKW